jgi:hypothetical protein
MKDTPLGHLAHEPKFTHTSRWAKGVKAPLFSIFLLIFFRVKYVFST